jgi:adenosylcobinamide-phosphate synthase
MGVTAAAVVVAAALDWLAGEPPNDVHPVAWFGRAVAAVDRPWTRPRLAGAVAAAALPLLAALGAAGVVAVAGSLVPPGATLAAAAVAAGVVLFVASSLRMLVDVAGDVAAATATDPDAGRRDLRALAGRDASALSPAEVRSAAVESAAENLADGLVAPLAGFVGGAGLGAAAVAVVPAFVPVDATLAPAALGAAGAAWVKGVNTLDSMLGYRTKAVGGASARLDDAVMFLPARAAAALLAVAAGSARALSAARPLAHRPASPNSGWPMATLAAVLGVRLEKPGRYDLAAGPALPTRADADRGVRIVRRAGVLAWGLAAAAAFVAEVGAWP